MFNGGEEGKARMEDGGHEIEVASCKFNTSIQKSIPYLWLKWPKSIPYLWPKQLKNPTLWGCTYLYRPYKGLPPIFITIASDLILGVRMTRGFGKLCMNLAKIWLFRPHSTYCQSKQEIRKWPQYLAKGWISFWSNLVMTSISNNYWRQSKSQLLKLSFAFFFTPFAWTVTSLKNFLQILVGRTSSQ